jgi:hypothetical protein
MNKLIKASIALITFAITMAIFQMCSKENVIAQAVNYVLPIATTTTLGGVKPDGTTILVDAAGKISVAGTPSLPIASTTTLGGVKPDGTSITVDGTGKISSIGSGQQRKILIALEGPDNISDIGELWVINYDGTGKVQIPMTGLPQNITWLGSQISPDGQSVFIQGYNPLGNISYIYSMSLTGTNVKVIFDGSATPSIEVRDIQAY